MDDDTKPPTSEGHYRTSRAYYDWETDPRPSTSFPATFTIGGKTTDRSLVRPDQLKGHLALLHAFHLLRSTIEDAGEGDRLPAWGIRLEPGRRWAWFVNLAVERFERWCRTVRYWPLEKFLAYRLPPIDVIMVWHAYLLNPGWYSEDCIRLPCLAEVKKLNQVFTACMTHWSEILAAPPSSSRVEAWVSKTSTSFDPIEASWTLTHKDVECPRCRAQSETPFINDSGTGYAQQNFSVICECGFNITKDRLGVLKFARVMAKNDSSHAAYLAGTLYTPTKAVDTARAYIVKRSLLSNVSSFGAVDFAQPGLSAEALERRILERVGYSREQTRLDAGVALKRGASTNKPVGRIMSAYTDDRPFSIELVGAVLRQGSFINKMHDLGWTEPGFFDQDEDEVVLQHCVARYHAFLDLSTSSAEAFFVPTLDIDLAWHTHQLMVEQYSRDCMMYVTRYVDHDDKVEENRLSTSFDLTCRAWQSRFRAPYMYCGCPLPGDTIGQKLRLLSVIYSTNRSFTGLHLPASEPALAVGTHPSDHSAVYISQNKKFGEAARKKRTEKDMRRRSRDAERVRKGKLPADAFSRGEEHGRAFLYPVPLYHSSAGAADCTTGSGNILNGGGCAAGAGGCSASICAVAMGGARPPGEAGCGHGGL